MNLNQSQLEALLKKWDIFCLKEQTTNQKNLRFASIIYLTIGGLFSVLIFLANAVVVAFFLKNQKSKRSPICILSFFLAIFNITKLLEFFINLVIKLDLLGLEKHKEILYGNSNKSNDFICKWLHFLPNFSGHIGVFLVLLLQFQRYLALKKTSFSFNLLLHNYALTYFICIGLLFTFLIVDEFYLFDAYFTTIVYCPRTMVFICVLNDRFKLLGMFKFDTMVYHHTHTFIYNILPVAFIILINSFVLIGLRKRANGAIGEAETRRSSSRQVSVTRAQSHSSLRRNSSINLKEQSQQQLKRARLSSSINLSSGAQPSPLQSIEFSVKRSKRESQLLHLNEIFLQNSDVNYLCVWISFAQIFNAIPTNVLSYLAEWTNSTTDHVKQLNLKNSGLNRDDMPTIDYETLYNNIPTKLLGTKITLPQIYVYYFFILYGCIDLFNFSVFLFYQFYSCRLLAFEFRKFLTMYSFFRLFLKPNTASRNRLNSSSTKISQRRASKI
jgi:hypothetical protein